MSNAAVTVDLNARIAQFETEMKRAVSSLDAFGKKGDAVSNTFKSFAKGLAGSLTVGAVVAYSNSIIDFADNLNDMSLRLGVGVKDLASFKLAAEQSSTSLDGVGAGIGELNKSIGLAVGGNKKIAAALEELGVTARDPKEAFFQLADAVERIEDPQKRAALMSKVLKGSYEELLPLLSQGGDALRESARQSETFAEAMARLAPDADKFNDQLADLKENAAAATASGLLPLVEQMNVLFERFSALQRLRNSGASLFEIITGGVSADYKDTLASVNADIAALEAKQKRLGTVRLSDGDREELARLKAIRAEAAALAVEDIMKPPKSAATGAPNAPRGGAADYSKARSGSSKKGIDKDDLYSDEMARNAKLVADETGRIAGDFAFMRDVDLEQNNPIAGVKQEWIEAGRAMHESMKTPLETLEDRLAYIDELMRLNVISVEDYGRAYAHALDDGNTKAKDSNDIARELGLTFESSFEKAIAGGEEFSDVLKGLAQDMLKIFAREAITKPVASWAGKAAANLFSFDGGGYTGSGSRSGGVDGKGGFISILHPDETVIDHTRTPVQARNAGGGGGVTVQNIYNIDARGADAGLEQRLRRMLDETESRAVSRSVFQVQSMNQRGQLRLS